MFETTRKLLVEVVNSHLSMEDKALLMSFAEGIPLWPDKDYSIYPGVRWKLLNIKKLRESYYSSVNIRPTAKQQREHQ